MTASIYLILCIVGTLLPYSQFLPFLSEHGLDIPLLMQQLFQNRISSFFAWDLIISSLVLWLFIFVEGRRQGMRYLWVYILCNLTVGVSLALPLFLYRRQCRLQATTESATAEQ